MLARLLCLFILLAFATPAWAAKFILGDRVVCNTVNAGCLTRSTPGGARLTSHVPGDQGSVIGGPTTTAGFTWWQVNFDTGDDGWFTEPNLDKLTVAALPGPTGTPTVTMVPSPVLGTALIGWTAPTTDAKMQPLTDLAGYRVYVGTASGKYNSTTTIAKDRVTATANNLVPGRTYFFMVTAFDTSNNESLPSDEVSKTIP